MLHGTMLGVRDLPYTNRQLSVLSFRVCRRALPIMQGMAYKQQYQRVHLLAPAGTAVGPDHQLAGFVMEQVGRAVIMGEFEALRTLLDVMRCARKHWQQALQIIKRRIEQDSKLLGPHDITLHAPPNKEWEPQSLTAFCIAAATCMAVPSTWMK